MVRGNAETRLSAGQHWPFIAESDTGGQAAHTFRAYSKMLYSGALMQAISMVDDIYVDLAQGANQSLMLGMGSPGTGSIISLRAPCGLAFGFLQHDTVKRFLLHFFLHRVRAWVYERKPDYPRNLQPI